MFQAKKWNWKRVAANLLLVPLLAGGSVAVVQAQLGRSSSSAGMPQMPTTASSMPKAGAAPAQASSAGDSKQFLKEGRKALVEGRFADAQDLAAKADNNNPSGKWGLFDDTPASLRKDIQAAQLKANKTQSDQLVKNAKALAAKPAENDAEKAYNLDNALQMARQAEKLHGPYSAWDWTDRADKLVKELEASRAKLTSVAKSPAKSPPANAVANNTQRPSTGNQPKPSNPQMPGGNTGAQQVAGGDAKKATAQKLMAEGQALANQGQFAAAKAKYTEADNLKVNFSPNEPNPGYSLRDLNTRGAAAIDQLVRDAMQATATKDYAKANASLTHAGSIAGALGLHTKPVTEAKATLWTASAGKYGAAAPGTAVASNTPNTGSPVGPVGSPPLFPPSTSGNPPVASNTPKPVAPVMPATPVAPVMPVTQVADNNAKAATPAAPVVPAALTAKQLLDQAAIEYENNQFDVAETLALKAHNLGMQKEARALLNSIEAKKDLMKKKGAAEAVANAKISYDQKDYQRTIGVLVLVDRKHLTEGDQKSVDQMLTACRAELSKAGAGDVVTTGGTQQPDTNPLPSALSPKGDPLQDVISPKDPTNPPGKAVVNSDAPTSAADSLRSVQFQKLRAEGLRVLDEAQKAYGRGETDLAMQMLMDYTNLVRISGLGAGSVGRLLLPVETRLDTFRMMKGQTDTIALQNRERREAKERITNRGVAEEERRREVSRLMRDCNDLVKQQNYAKAEGLALQAKQLDPDEPAITAMLEMIKMTKRVKYAEDAKKQREEFFLQQMNNAEEVGPIVTGTNPVAVQLDALRRSQSRGSGDHYLNRQRSRMEYEIETKLENPISLELNLTPLNLAIQNFQTKTGLPVYLDQRALDEEHISPVQPITFEPGSAIAAKHVLTTILDQAGLSYVVEHDMVKVTTVKKSKGRMVTKVFSVADLVTPVPNFALPDYANFDKMLKLNPISSGNLVAPGLTPGFGTTTPQVPPGGLIGGQQASLLSGDLANQAGIQPGIRSPFGQGGTLQPQMSPLAGSASVTSANNSKHEQLIKLITSMIRPYSWDGAGGGGKVEFFDIGSALVVNQTADVISEVSELLEALRRLQDLAIAVEVRIVSLAESFFERMGVDFAINIKTHTTSFEPSLTGPGGVGPGTFRPQPFINDINNKGVTIGLTPAGSFTPDLDVPIRATSFQRGIPGFGNYPNAPGNNGGVSLGLAFLNDIQVYTFMELAQGDMRSNIMQAPKLTLFNGQTSTLSVQDTQFFVTSVQVFSVNGQIVFIPQNTPLPGPDTNFNITIQAVVSADRRFVRLNLPVTLSAQSGAAVPLFPVTTFITPVFEGGSQGQPIPFTQFLQQPSFTTLTIQTTVVCPDGGTVLLGGLKTVRESRNEFGPPFLSKIPYFNRLFKNVGVGRDTRHIMIMVTPRIIINSEEEIFQTEGRLPGQGAAPGG